MSDLITFYDATNADSIPANVVACAGYCDADFAGVWKTLVDRFPELAKQQRVLSVGTRAGTVCRIFDVEPGNPLSATEAAEQVKLMVAHGVYRPGIYADGSDMPAVRAALKATGLGRHQYVLWLASPTGVAPSAAWLVANDLDAMQYGWSSKGQAPVGTDVNVALADFFPPLVKPKPKPKPTTNSGVARFEGEVDLKTGKAQIHGVKGDAVFGGPRKRLHYKVGLEVGTDGGGWHVHKTLI